MGRPKHASYQSYQLIYARLLKGPLWLEDWKSTGLKSRSTVHKRLRHLVSEGLVIPRRAGHKILYEIAPLKNERGIITRESLFWQKYLYPISRKEKRHIKRQIREHVKEIMELQRPLTLGLRIMAEINKEIDKIIDLPESRAVFNVLREVGVNWEEIPIPKLLKFLLIPHLAEQICLDCLRREKIIVFYVTDHETGEVICPYEGIVVREETFETIRPSRERPSPFPPPKENQ